MVIHKRKHQTLNKILCLFLPERCPYCDKLIDYGELFCKDCKNNFKGTTYKKPAKGGFPCISAAPYINSFADAIKRFKFSNRKQYAYQLARITADAIVKEYAEEEFDFITYVPMHRLKQREKGYNHSQLLAKELSSILGIPLKAPIVKIRNNEPQHTIASALKREENVKGAFKVAEKSTVKDKRVLLIDDIITTGNTLGECARILQKSKAQSIHCVTFCVAVAKTT